VATGDAPSGGLLRAQLSFTRTCNAVRLAPADAITVATSQLVDHVEGLPDVGRDSTPVLDLVAIGTGPLLYRARVSADCRLRDLLAPACS
jgi:hypothetical protein